MGETEDPRASLRARDVRTRAAATRDLARAGRWEDMEALVEVALRDKSTSVRLYAAASAADIAARHRGAAGQTSLTAEQAAQIHAWVGSVDPGGNPSLLLLMAAVADKTTLGRLGRLLRDPRNGVRRGAVAVVRRLALSGASVGDERLTRAVLEWMGHPKVSADVVLDLIHIVGEAGWESCREAVIAGSTAGRPHGEAAALALSRLDERGRPGALEGLWVCEGLDVMEVGPPRDRGWLLVRGDDAWSPGGGPSPWPPTDRSMRVVWAPVLREVAEERRVAIQCDGTTWWRCEGKDLVKAIDDFVLQLPGDAADALVHLAAGLEEVDGALAIRARALLLWRAGDLPGAAALLQGLCAHKRPRADVFWWLGRVLADQGRAPEAMAALEGFLERAGKRAVYRDEAAALLERLRE